jgi:putative transposase
MNTLLHHPPHLFINQSLYFITAHTLGSEPVLKPDTNKKLVETKLKILAESFQLKIWAFVILDNHYHLLIKIGKAKIIPVFINRLHGSTSYLINKTEERAGRPVWHNYWDRVIRDERDFWTKFNYIHYNPVKHGYVQTPEGWHYSSSQRYLRIKGEDWISDCWQSFPVIEYEFEN